MFKVICVTQRSLVKGDFCEQIEKICKAGADRVILREKDMSPAEYTELAKRVMEICSRYDVPFSVNTFTDIAKELGSENIHLSYRDFAGGKGKGFACVGVSVHSAEEAAAAERGGASYLIAGHIFVTDCKKGIPPRGTQYLEEICRRVSVPVYGIGGINEDNAKEVSVTGADGVCIMSGLMKAEHPDRIIDSIHAIK
ncbi:MAG: thiamine phosphate synthase [Huintestinicola sp.]